jgi:hypothetical protein
MRPQDPKIEKKMGLLSCLLKSKSSPLFCKLTERGRATFLVIREALEKVFISGYFVVYI